MKTPPNNIWNKDRSAGFARHAMGAYLPSAKLASKAFMAGKRDRKAIRGGRPFWFVFGGPTGDVSLGANQWVELRHKLQSDFILLAVMGSATVGTAASPGFRFQIQDLSIMPGKGKKFALAGVNNVNGAGTAKHPFFLRKPYRFVAGRTVVAKLQNLQSSTNNVQLVLYGVIDE